MRRRITAIASAIVAVVLVAVAVVVVIAVQAELYDNLDRSLDQRAADVASSFGVGSPELASSDLEDHFAQVLDGSGAVVAATENATDIRERWPLPESGTVLVVERRRLPIEDDVYRVLVRADTIGGAPGYVVVGENIDDLRDTVRELIIVLVVVIPLALVLLAVTVWWLVGRTLGAVDAIRRDVDEIELADLGRRVTAPGTRDEVDQLAGTMNRMLGRLEQSSGRQRQFVADVSHELRTPLTRLRTAIEVEIAHPSDDRETALGSALSDLVEMQTLVDDLLFLARMDAGTVPVRWVPIDLDVLIAGEVAAAHVPSSVEVDLSGVEPVELRGDEAQLARVVRNLLANAVRHADTAVAIGVVERDGAVELWVDDDGAGVPAEDRTHVFERFGRPDHARSGRDGGAGLGLAIVAEIVAAHRGEVRIEEADLGGARFVVTLPTG